MAQDPRGDPVGYYFRELLLIRQEKTTRLYLVRHAQSHGNTGEASDASDPGLTPVGREQARRLAERTAHQGIDAIYSSPLRRSLETAQAVAEATGLPVTAVDGLREVSLGSEGDPMTITAERARDLMESILDEGTWDAFPGSEGSQAFRHRVAESFDRIIAECPGKRVAVVTHAGVIQIFVSQVLGLKRDFVFYPFNAGITSIRALGDRRVLWRLNDVAHLDGLPPGFGGIS